MAGFGGSGTAEDGGGGWGSANCGSCERKV